MKSKTVWATRDEGKDRIKIWAQEPKFVEPNGVWVAKDYLGCSCIEQWPGPSIEGGQRMQVAIMIAEAL